ncbi:diguanylate cyclase, partial [Streptomyces sp. NPDC127074]
MTDNGEIGGRPVGVDGRLRAVVGLAQEMAAAHTSQESVGGAAPTAPPPHDRGLPAVSGWGGA